MSKSNHPTAERLRSILRYESETGLFTRLVSTSSNAKKGDVAGSLDKYGYLRIWVDGKHYKAHRLAWLYMTGEHPSEEVDHMNGVRTDNRWSNLRPASNQENSFNRKKHINNSSGFTGVSFHRKTGKWRARITLNGISYPLGYHDNPKQASLMYEGAAALAFGHWKRKTTTTTTTTTTEEVFA